MDESVVLDPSGMNSFSDSVHAWQHSIHHSPPILIGPVKYWVVWDEREACLHGSLKPGQPQVAISEPALSWLPNGGDDGRCVTVASVCWVDCWGWNNPALVVLHQRHSSGGGVVLILGCFHTCIISALETNSIRSRQIFCTYVNTAKGLF